MPDTRVVIQPSVSFARDHLAELQTLEQDLVELDFDAEIRPAGESKFIDPTLIDQQVLELVIQLVGAVKEEIVQAVATAIATRFLLKAKSAAGVPPEAPADEPRRTVRIVGPDGETLSEIDLPPQSQIER